MKKQSILREYGFGASSYEKIKNVGESDFRRYRRLKMLKYEEDKK